MEYIIEGKYEVSHQNGKLFFMTDNAREAVWWANKGKTIKNICGEKDFYQTEDGTWHSKDI